MRKTIDIIKLIESVNKFNAQSFDSDKMHREGRNTFLECILHDTGNYRGFTYLGENDISEYAQSVGIREQYPDGSWNFNDTDRTRVRYYIADHL